MEKKKGKKVKKQRSNKADLHQSTMNSYQKNGTMLKLAGYLFKTQEKRHFVLYRNKLAYYVHKSDPKPKRVICLDGCSVEILSDAPPYSFNIIERATVPTHTYTLFPDNRKDFNSWVEMIKRASYYYQEILYSGVAKDTEIVIEYCFPHWQSEKQQFQKLTSEILQQQRYRIPFTGGQEEQEKKGFFTKFGFRVVYLVAEGLVFFCVVDARMANPRAEAFIADIRERFCTITVNEDSLKEFVWLMKELMEVYSPGYDYKDPDKVETRDKWLKKMGENQTPEQMMDQLIEKAKGK